MGVEMTTPIQIKEIDKFFGILKPGEGKKYLRELRNLEFQRDKRFNHD